MEWDEYALRVLLELLTKEIVVSLRFEDLRVYQLAEELADNIWEIVMNWERFAMDTVGRQVVRSADGIGANIAEGTGRGSFDDNRRFVLYARGSLYETKSWLRRAFKRHLLTKSEVDAVKPLLDELGPKLNAYLNSIGTKRTQDKSNQ